MIKKDLQKFTRKFPVAQNILGKEEFFNAAVLIPLVNADGEYNFLFEKRATNIRQGGEICFPGGEIEENDKSIEETILRETFEEIGVNQERIQILGKLDTLIGPRGMTVDSCVGIVDISSIGECHIDKSEVEKIFLVPVSFFENNVQFFLPNKVEEFGKEKVKQKFDWMYNRISSEKAKQIVKAWYEKAIKDLESV